MAAAQEAIEGGRKAIADHKYRRKGWGVSTMILTLLMVLLIFKIRDMDRRVKT